MIFHWRQWKWQTHFAILQEILLFVTCFLFAKVGHHVFSRPAVTTPQLLKKLRSMSIVRVRGEAGLLEILDGWTMRSYVTYDVIISHLVIHGVTWYSLPHTSKQFAFDCCIENKIYRRIKFKEQLPQAFMQIEWMENDFKNLTVKVWASLDNPIKSYDFSKFCLISCMPPSQVALC